MLSASLNKTFIFLFPYNLVVLSHAQTFPFLHQIVKKLAMDMAMLMKTVSPAVVMETGLEPCVLVCIYICNNMYS